MSDETKKLKVKAPQALFDKLGSSFALQEVEGGPYRFALGAPKRGDKPAVEAVTEHEIVLSRAQAQQLVHDGYEVPGLARWHEPVEKQEVTKKK
jgi:hypothetical protein